MTEQKTYDPYETLKKLGEHWEKQMNELVHFWTDNKEFLKYTNLSTDYQSRYIEMIRNSQEIMATQLNIPTKKDLANVSKIAIQTEGKLDALEEQIWKITDSVSARQEEISEVVEVSHEVIKLTKRLRTELTRMKKEVAVTNDLQKEVQELREEISNFGSLKEELAEIKALFFEQQALNNEKEENEAEKELVETGKSK